MALYVGMDAGGTRSRAAVLDASGALRGTAVGLGANPVSHVPERAFDALAGTLRAALDGLPASDVRGLVLGLAGAGTSGRIAVADLARAAGLACPAHAVGDVVTAFAAGTAEPDGTVLVSGTGATAVRIVGRCEAAVADGNGWLLGDDGSGLWLGREAVRAALAALDGRGAPTTLLTAVTAALLGAPLATGAGREGAERVVAAVHGEPPIALARLAPLVSAAAAAGDGVAGGIVARAADALVGAVAAVRASTERTPIVLAGSVVAGPTPVADRTRDALAERWPGCVRMAGDPAKAAAWLAAVRSGLPARLHRTMVSLP
ncbi:N-acetylglucosamine kinase-like BadF-type ATPase [Pseudonocardia hierapolitana]|uniref:N-acetylglucosamine kinase-like BadF-type ATPase n=1 Tax=Pseudonocardia hierapolitana TaxID=1128676 RepID=A0A561SQJ7_9PSEU|nr:BadF/BadG/BcrA/BcrD ATPase family protein [Pseudonocardia hierapolitana]TWF77140.1 N-acetylglucosamine kinase-like BadF-type ATPase [Pseudonocardia hierapolitana]